MEDLPLATLAALPDARLERVRRRPVGELVGIEVLQLDTDALRQADPSDVVRVQPDLPLEGLDVAVTAGHREDVRLDVERGATVEVGDRVALDDEGWRGMVTSTSP